MSAIVSFARRSPSSAAISYQHSASDPSPLLAAEAARVSASSARAVNERVIASAATEIISRFMRASSAGTKSVMLETPGLRRIGPRDEFRVRQDVLPRPGGDYPGRAAR